MPSRFDANQFTGGVREPKPPKSKVHLEGPAHKERATVGQPDGKPTFRPEFGRKVGTFTMARADLDLPTKRNIPRLMFHVPYEFRGPYRPHQLPTFTGDPEDYLTSNEGYVICEATTRAGGGCLRMAVNRQTMCESHGARLHPLDKVAAVLRTDPSNMTRYELLRHGYIDVDDLTELELQNGVDPRTNQVVLPKAIYQKLVARHFEYAQQLMQTGLLGAIETLKDIATNDNDLYEASDRIKASVYIIERVMGKTPDVVVHAQAQEPWQKLVTGLTTMSREESRASRGEALQGVIEDENKVIEAELVELPSVPSKTRKKLVRRPKPHPDADSG